MNTRMTGPALALLLAAGAPRLLHGDTPPGAAWLEGGWAYRRLVRIEEGFYLLSRDLPLLPLLVAIAEPADPVFAHARDDGRDLRFTDRDGSTLLPHETELFRNADGDPRLACWVRIPVVRADEDTLCYLYYGNKAASAPPEELARQVWANGFAAVWHFGGTNDPGRTPSATGAGHAVKRSGEVTPAPGLVAAAACFGREGALDCGILPGLAASASCTLEAWVKYTEDPVRGPRTTRNIVSTPDVALFRHEALRWQGRLAGATTEYVMAWDPAPMGVWRHLALVYDAQSTDFTLFVDGKPATGGAAHRTGATRSGGPTSANRPLVVGGDWIGALDEVRVSTVARSAEWLAISYRNQKRPGTRITVGREEARTR